MFWHSTGSLDIPPSYNFSHEEMAYGSETYLGSSTSKIRLGWGLRSKCLTFFLVIFIIIAIVLAVAVAYLSVTLIQTKNELKMERPCLTSECVQVAGKIMGRMDTSIDPCEDFYEFACGGWIKTNPVPSTETTWGQFEIVREKLAAQLKEILEEYIEDENSVPKQFLMTQEFYDTCITQDEPDRDNFELLSTIDRLIGSTDTFSPSNFSTILANLRRELDGDYIFSLDVDLDERNTTNYAIYLDQPRLGLSFSYLTDPEENQQKKNYQLLIQTIWSLVFPDDESRAPTIAQDIVKIETALASISSPADQRRNKSLLYNVMNMTELQTLTVDESSLNWKIYFQEVFKDAAYYVMRNPGLNVTIQDDDDEIFYNFTAENDTPLLNFQNYKFIMRDADYFKRLAQALDVNYNGRDILNYLKWRVILDYGGEVSDKLRDAFYEYAKITYGLILQPSRWRICVEKTSALLGTAISYRYVEKHFTDRHVNEASVLVQDLMKAFGNILKELDWLDPTTRELALKKALKMKAFIGYPDWLHNRTMLRHYYKGLSTLKNPENHFLNYVQIAKWHYTRQLSKFFKLKDSSEWIVEPTVVNAFYSYEHNSINFPAGILQPPFFRMPMQALNYGAIGSIIGHEISHGFDDTGRQSDLNGNVADWWNPKALEAYIERSKCFVDEYASFNVQFGESVWHVDGNNTLSENIADNGGMRQAFEAYKLYTSRNGVEGPLPGLEQYTPNQLFFVAFAQVWCGSYTTASLQQQISNGVHSPNEFRVNGTLRNFQEFYDTWSCRKPTSKEDKGKMCRIW